MKFTILAVFLLIAFHSTQCEESQKPKEKDLSKGKNEKRSVYGELDLGYPIHDQSIDNHLEISHGGHLNLGPLQDSIILEPTQIQLDQIGSAPISDEDSVVVESANARASLNGGLLIPSRNLNLNQGGSLLVQLPSTLNTFGSASISNQDSIIVESAGARSSLNGGLLIPARNLNLNRGVIQLPPTLNTLNRGIGHTQVEIQRSIEIPQPSSEGWSSQEIPIDLRFSQPSLQRANNW